MTLLKNDDAPRYKRTRINIGEQGQKQISEVLEHLRVDLNDANLTRTKADEIVVSWCADNCDLSLHRDTILSVQNRYRVTNKDCLVTLPVNKILVLRNLLGNQSLAYRVAYAIYHKEHCRQQSMI